MLAASAETGGAGQPSGQILSADERPARELRRGVLVITEAQLRRKRPAHCRMINGHVTYCERVGK